MQDTSIIFSLFKGQDSVCVQGGADEYVLEMCRTGNGDLPYAYVKRNEELLPHLGFTVVFLMAVALLRLRGQNLVANLSNVLLKRKRTEMIQNEGIVSNLFGYLLALLLSFSVLTVGIGLFFSVEFFSKESLKLMGMLLGYHFFLLMMVHWLGWTFNQKNLTSEMVVNIWTFHIAAGLLVSPFVIALFFVKSVVAAVLLKFLVLGAVVFIIFKMLRWMAILLGYGVSILYMILYLCVLEFMPLLLLYKAMVVQG